MDQIVDEISAEIRTGVLLPGDRLPSERLLCERFSVGRSSVREALRSLSSNGLIDIQVGRGSFVDKILPPGHAEAVPGLYVPADLPHASLVEARLAFEPQVAALAARRATSEHLEQLRRAVDRLEAELGSDYREVDSCVSADMAFHECLTRASGNLLYLSFHRAIETTLFELWRRQLTGSEGSLRVLESHQEIYAAVEAGDPGAAAGAMWKHVLRFADGLNVVPDLSSMGLLPRGTEGTGEQR